MKSVNKKTVYFCLVAVLLSLSGALAAQTDPNLSLAIRRTNQNVVLRWFASNGLPYQVESTTTFAAWTNSSLVLTGSGGFLFVTNSISGNSNAFFRVKRLDMVSASFN